MTVSAETIPDPKAFAPLAPIRGEGPGVRGEPASDTILCHVIYVRVSLSELEALKSTANAAKLSLQRHARITLGLKDRGGYRNRVHRKEQPNGQTEINAAAEAQTEAPPLAKGNPE